MKRREQDGGSFHCPAEGCDGHMIVRDSRPLVEVSGIRRRRMCVKCGFRVGTRELVFNQTDHDPQRMALMETMASLGKLNSTLHAQIVNFLRVREWDDL